MKNVIKEDELNDVLSEIYLHVKKSSEKNFDKFTSLYKNIDKWILSSDDCLDDKRKPNDTICFSLFPCVDIIELKEIISQIQPNDLKNTRNISDEFCQYLKRGYSYNFVFTVDKNEKSFLREMNNIDKLRETVSNYINYLSAVSQKNNEELNEHIESFKRLKNHMDAKQFNSKLLFRIMLSSFLAACIKQFLIDDIVPINKFVWIPDRGDIVSFADGIYKDFYWLYSKSQIIKGKNIVKCKFLDALPDYSEEFTYDELIRIPDILCGIISDYNINTNELSGEKQRKGVERIIIENSYISIYRFKKNGMAKVTIENEL